MNGYTPPTEYERISARAQQLRVDLTEALGGYDRYLNWANELSVNTHLDRRLFCNAAEVELARIETDAAEIMGKHFRNARRLRIVEEETLIDTLKWQAEIAAQAADHADLLDTQECARG